MRLERAMWATWVAASLGLASVLGLAQDSGEPDPFVGVPVGGGPVTVGPTPTGLTSVDAAACGGCHERHYAEWESSAHHTAYTNAVFVAEYSTRRRAFCRRCHAPRPEVADAGIDCAVCHVRDGAVINPTVSGRAPHPSRATPALSGPGACARCHEFDFENQPGERLQATLREWSNSAARDEGHSCQDCHMEARGGAPSIHHRHDAPGARDRELRERAIDVDARARRTEDGRTQVELSLSVAGAGHAVPTGDMFRRLEVSAWPVIYPERAERAWLLRRFRVDREGWHQSADTRVPERGTREVALDLGPARWVDWTVHLWLLPRSEAEAAGIPLEDARLLMTRGRVRVE